MQGSTRWRSDDTNPAWQWRDRSFAASIKQTFTEKDIVEYYEVTLTPDGKVDRKLIGGGGVVKPGDTRK